MRRNWPVDNAAMISDYHGVVSGVGRVGVGCCGMEPMQGFSGVGALDAGQSIGMAITVAGVATVLGLALFAMRG